MPPLPAVQKASRLAEQGRLAEAAGVLRGWLERAPGDAAALAALWEAPSPLGGAAEWAREAVRRNPESLPALSLLAYSLNCTGSAASGDVRAAHEAYGRALMRGTPAPAPFANPPEPERRVRVGLLSPDFREHSV